MRPAKVLKTGRAQDATAGPRVSANLEKPNSTSVEATRANEPPSDARANKTPSGADLNPDEESKDGGVKQPEKPSFSKRQQRFMSAQWWYYRDGFGNVQGSPSTWCSRLTWCLQGPSIRDRCATGCSAGNRLMPITCFPIICYPMMYSW